MKVFILLVFSTLLTYSFAQKETKASILKDLERIANENIPAPAINVRSISYNLNGCALTQTTHLKDSTSWDRTFELSANDYRYDYYSRSSELWDIMIGGKSFVAAFKDKAVAEEFMEKLKQLSVLCKDTPKEDRTRAHLHELADFVYAWNNARNLKNVTALKHMYADTVDYFGHRWSKKTTLIDIQILFIRENYGHTLESLKISYLNDSTALCKMNLGLNEGLEWESPTKLLTLLYSNGQLTITGETDNYPTPERPQMLSEDRDFFFEHEYWLDIYDSKTNSHSFVPYLISFDVFMYGNDNIDIELYTYDGSKQEMIDFTSADVQMKGGYLSFHSIPDDGIDYNEEDAQFFKFKIVSNEALIFVETEGWYSSAIGATFQDKE